MYCLVVVHHENYESWVEGPYTEEDAVTRRNYLWDSAEERGETMGIEMYPYREAADR